MVNVAIVIGVINNNTESEPSCLKDDMTCFAQKSNKLTILQDNTKKKKEMREQTKQVVRSYDDAINYLL